MESKVQTGVILVGGAGLRMRPLTKDIPKAMIKLRVIRLTIIQAVKR